MEFIPRGLAMVVHALEADSTRKKYCNDLVSKGILTITGIHVPLASPIKHLCDDRMDFDLRLSRTQQDHESYLLNPLGWSSLKRAKMKPNLHNTFVNGNTGYRPIRIDYSVQLRRSLALMTLPRPTNTNGRVFDFVSGLLEIRNTEHDKLSSAANRCNAKAGTRRRHVELEYDDDVWSENYNKLDARKIGLVDVIGKIHPKGYRLKLLSHIRTADVFSVKHLVPFHGDASDDDDIGNLRTNSSDPGGNDGTTRAVEEAVEAVEPPGQSLTFSDRAIFGQKICADGLSSTEHNF